MLKAFILDDEIKALELLKSYIEQIDFLTLIGESRNPVKAFQYLQETTIDVLFLDINMPLLNGVDLYKNIRKPPAVIFTTAYPEYAVEGFNLEAVDYLLKPITFPRFLKACERLLKQKNAEKPKFSESSYVFDIVYVKSGAVTHKLFWKDVLYLEKNENYVIYHSKDKRILSRQTLSDLEEIFPSYLCRIHKSYAVSLLHIQRLEREFLTLVGGQNLPIGRTYKDKLKTQLTTIKKES